MKHQVNLQVTGHGGIPGQPLRPADALQLATALLGGATLFVTNDRDLTRVTPVLPVLVLEDLDTTSP
ncbi:MAG TPA: PIN domain-containing protein [Anaerolineae bacterium]|nr:PIN domain-containing protein [Anaerolineae bacterium]HQM15154.1 PIN domain-containing protein [Anaerolineae bacterium]